MTHSPRLKPFMAYLGDREYVALKRFAKSQKMAMSSVVREAINARVASGDRYVAGFNDGLDAAIKSVQDLPATQMRFPSGKSFAELIEEALVQLRMVEDETT